MDYGKGSQTYIHAAITGVLCEHSFYISSKELNSTYFYISHSKELKEKVFLRFVIFWTGSGNLKNPHPLPGLPELLHFVCSS